MRLRRLAGLEILDSLGRPTVRATCLLDSGASAAASVPSGTSKGSAEARELRDCDPARYGGLGCRKAVAAIEGELNNALAGRRFRNQQELDRALVELDGTPDKSRLGANSLLAVSIAFARVSAAEHGLPLYAHLAGLVDGRPAALPRPTINLFSGGRHAGGQVAVQDVQVVPAVAASLDDALALTFDVYHAAAELVLARHGMRELTALEGGLAPAFENAEQMLATAVEAIGGKEIALAVDVAATHFHRDGRYQLDGDALDSDALVERLLGWLERYPIIAVEDPLAEHDWRGFAAFRAAAAGRVLVVGDDLLCTSPTRIRRAAELGAADALLLKVNQVGTLTEAAEAYALARAAGWRVIASARSGETEDDWLADLAVGWSADLVKIGSIRQSERLAKYNRLLAIERETHFPLAQL